MAISVRQATNPRELTVAFDMERRIFSGDRPYTDYTAKWWIVWEGEEPVGFCALAPLANEPGGWFLARSGLIKRMRGKRIQRKLVRVREAYVRRSQGTCVITYTSPENMPSANNLIACGYKLYSPFFRWGCSGAIYFKKALK